MDLASIVQDGVRWYGDTLKQYGVWGQVAQAAPIFVGADIVSERIAKGSLKNANWRKVSKTLRFRNLRTRAL